MTTILTEAAAVILLAASVAFAAETRYDDVAYLADLGQPPLPLRVTKPTDITFSRDPRSILAHLEEGQVVTVFGLGERQDYVSVRIASGPARGWVDANALESPPAELVAKLKEQREKAAAHRALIERHDVGAGMTQAEVLASLGKPERKARVRALEGEQEQWFYVTYRYMPYYTRFPDEKGKAQQLVSYRREPAGHRIVTFRNGEVVEVTLDETNAPPATGD